eukprot:364456-Chlamydomonas_euryale.AAC.5
MGASAHALLKPLHGHQNPMHARIPCISAWGPKWVHERTRCQNPMHGRMGATKCTRRARTADRAAHMSRERMMKFAVKF